MVQLTIIYKDLTKITTNWYNYNNKEIINVERFAWSSVSISDTHSIID